MVSNASGPLQGQAGIFLFDENVEAIGNDYAYNSLALTDTTLSRQKNDAEAIFGSLEYTFTSALKVRAGLRFTEDHKTFSVPYTNVAGGLPPPESASARASRVNWDFSPTYQLAPNVNLYARIATGFRAPSFGAPSAGPPPLPVQIARSEDNISYETGIKAEMFERRASIAFDVYYFNVSHQQPGSSVVTNNQAWYAQVAYRLPMAERWKPYYRYEYIHTPLADVIFRGLNLGLSGSTFGVRYDISSFAAFKFEWRNQNRPGLPTINLAWAQTDFTF